LIPPRPRLNMQIFETIYHGALEASSEMVEREAGAEGVVAV
jgi:hypothetical protein